MCTACGRSGHEASSYFKVVEYPEWWEDRSRNKSTSRGPVSAPTGRGRGFPPRANITQIPAANSAAAISTLPLNEADLQGLSGLSDEQWRIVQRVESHNNPLNRLSGKTIDTMKDLGHAKYFLGLEIARSPEGFYLCQRKYAIDIVTEAGLLGCKPAGSPIDQNHGLALPDGPVLSNPVAYRRLVGRLVYLASTRPDLSYVIHVLSQFMQKPKEAQWQAALKVVRYLKGTLGKGILLHANSPLHLKGWCDSDYAGCPLTRKSLTGWFVQFGESPISWKTKKQKTTSSSSAEAEYRAMATICRELRCLKSLLFELGIDHQAPISLFSDSQAALHISSNLVFHERTKHIEIDCHVVRDYIVDGIVKASHVDTTDQLADILTKALGQREFDVFLHKLGIQNLHAPT
ncbi:PREDICTED: uncharacterized protein LOC109127282 [Camelina sativa]|uniref:Uncharacterized protein LOC109127282 n=1 Tax=Camelina sativa TaxID=90675 RepID=A0ABM1QKX4_CAMSA|nr:PREDICTED: uncharacterized protein LOC109127282 [Camelina sativa]